MSTGAGARWDVVGAAVRTAHVRLRSQRDGQVRQAKGQGDGPQGDRLAAGTVPPPGRVVGGPGHGPSSACTTPGKALSVPGRPMSLCRSDEQASRPACSCSCTVSGSGGERAGRSGRLLIRDGRCAGAEPGGEAVPAVISVAPAMAAGQAGTLLPPAAGVGVRILARPLAKASRARRRGQGNARKGCQKGHTPHRWHPGSACSRRATRRWSACS